MQTKAIADTGCTGHYINEKTPQTPVHVPTHSLPTVKLPDGSTISATHAAELPLPNVLSKQATLAYSFPTMSNPLISIGQLCDDGCTAIFTASKCYVVKENALDTSSLESLSILQGDRNCATNLWYFNLNSSSIPKIQNNANTTVYEMKKQDLIEFHHKACFSPVKDTWLKAIKHGFFESWPGLSYTDVNKHLQLQPATAKGHLRQKRQNYRSTKPEVKNKFEMTVSPNTRQNDVFIKPVEATKQELSRSPLAKVINTSW